ncbi:MAG: hypothetical protein EA401_12980 [Planctomycetota bacterium]|nr:MAG: hypothetical protein EA401_12980 [Planctomycetota bacterium]
MNTPPASPFIVRLLGWAGVALFLLIPVLWLIYLGIVRSTGATGWEMRSVDKHMLNTLQASESTEAFLQLFGASSNEAISEQLSYIGSPGPFTQRGSPTAFVFVPSDRVINTPLGTLIIFDRSSEELLQQQSLRNILLLLSATTLILATTCIAIKQTIQMGTGFILK